MKASDILDSIEARAVAGRATSKSTAEGLVEYGTEKDASEHCGTHFANYTKLDQAMLYEGESKASTSSIIAPEAAATMDGSTTPYSRRLSTTSPPADMDMVDMAEVPQASSSLAKPRLKHPQTLDDVHQDDRPLNFGIILPDVYRSSYPKTEDYPFLKNLGLKTVVTLVQKEFPNGYKSFLSENGIRHHVFDMQGTKKEAIPIKTMGAILRLVLNPRNHPLLIHCNHGRHRTGCVVAVIRKSGGWNLSSILEEYKMYAEPKIRDCDVEYITSFNTTHLSNLWARESAWEFRIRRFCRATTFTFFILVIWLYSGSEMAGRAVQNRQPTN